MTIHHDWTLEGLEVVGRVWDVSKAYRQLARSPAHAAFAAVASRCSPISNDEIAARACFWRVFVCNEALWLVAVVFAQITWALYVDDDFLVAFRQVAPEIESFMDGFFDLPGWPCEGLGGICSFFPSTRSCVHLSRRGQTSRGRKHAVQIAKSQRQSVWDLGPHALEHNIGHHIERKTAIRPYPGIRQLRRSRLPLCGSGRRRERLVRSVASWSRYCTTPRPAKYQPHSSLVHRRRV